MIQRFQSVSILFLLTLSACISSLNAQQTGTEPIEMAFFEQFKEAFNWSDEQQFKEIGKHSKGATEHFKFQHYYKGLPIHKAQYNYHKNRQADDQTISGKIYSNVDQDIPNNLPSKLQSINSVLGITLTTDDFCEMIWYDPYYSGKAANLKLCHHFIYISEFENFAESYFIDIVNNEIIGKEDLLHLEDFPATGEATYIGPVDFTCNQKEGAYFLENSMGGGMAVYDKGQSEFYLSNFDEISNASPEWENSQTDAIAALKGLEWTHQTYQEYFNHNGFDNNNSPIVANINTALFGSPNGAAWSALHNEIFCGSGDGEEKNALVSLDIIGHEFTHGVIQHTCALNYKDESGAINEGLCDIFATYIGFKQNESSANWQVGENVVIEHTCIRNLQNPNDINAATQQPSTYLGDFWSFDAEDNGGIHINSGVLNYWFYLLSEGGSGTNDFDYEFLVEPIGMDEAMQLIYHCMTNYLYPSVDFPEMKNLSIQAAQELYGEDGQEVEKVRAAWCAVGLGDCNPDNFDKSISIQFPNGNESFEPGQNIPIVYSTTGNVEEVNIEVSFSCGNDFTIVQAALNNNGIYNWASPDVNSSLLAIKITDVDDLTVFDKTDDCFSLSFDACEIDFEIESNSEIYCLNNEYNFSFSTNDATADYHWYVNNNFVSDELEMPFNFAEPGNYLIELRASNETCQTSKSIMLSVLPEPSSEFYHSGNEQYISFYPTFQNLNYNANYLWLIEGESYNSQSLNYAFPSAGSFEVCLEVSTACSQINNCNTIEISASNSEENPCSFYHSDEEIEIFSNSNDVRGILVQDNFLWAASIGGLIKWDTISKTYTKYTTENGLSDLYINCIEEDSQGNLWMGTHWGLNKYDKLTDSFEHFIDQDFEGVQSVPRQINHIAIDFDDNVYVESAERLFKFYNGVYTFDNLFEMGLFNEGENIQELFVDSQNRLWIGSNLGKVIYKTGDNFTTIPQLISSNINSFVELPLVNKILIGTHNQGLWKYDFSNLIQLTEYPHQSANEFLYQNENLVWIASESDLIKYDGTNFTPVEYDCINHITGMDNTGTNDVWLGSTLGIFRYIEGVETDDLQSLETEDFYNQSRSANLFIGPGKELFLDLAYGKILRYDWQEDIGEPLAFSGSNNHIIGMGSDHENNLFLIQEVEEVEEENDVQHFALFKYDGNEIIKLIDLPNSQIAEYDGKNIIIDLDLNVYFCSGYYSNTIGIWKYDGETISQIVTESDGLTAVKKMITDHENNLWFSDSENGLFKYSLDNGVQNLLNSQIGDPEQLAVDQNNHLWIQNYNTQLFEFDGENLTDHSSNIGLTENTPYESIQQLIAHSDGSIWLSSYRGKLVRYQPGGNTSYYDLDSGHYGNIADIIEGENGNIWMNSLGGLSKLKVNSSQAHADFEAEGNFCVGDTLNFINNSSNAVNFEWLVNDQYVSDQLDFELPITFVGLVDVTLIAYDNNHCSQSKTVAIQSNNLAELIGGDEYIYDCISMKTEVFAGQLNLPEYLWIFQGELLGKDPYLSVETSGIYTLNVTDHCGNTHTKKYEIILNDACQSELVWPGDINNDKIVDQVDILYYGLSFGETGPSRQNQSAVWQAHEAPSWYEFQINNTNAVHSDANGNGICDLDDSEVLIENYGNFYGPQEEPILVEANFTIEPQIEGEIEIINDNGNYFALLNIVLVLSSEDADMSNNFPIYGLAGELEWNFENPDNSIFIESVNEIEFGNTCFEMNEDAIFSHLHFDETSNKMSFGFTRLDYQNIHCTGGMPIARLGVFIDDNLPLFDEGGSSFSLEINNGQSVVFGIGIDDLGQSLNLSTSVNFETLSGVIPPIPADVMEGLSSNTVKSNLSLYPNPANQQINIVSKNQADPIVKCQLISLEGKLIKNIPHLHSSQIDLSDLNEGVYILKSYSENVEIYFNKIVVAR